MTFEQVMAIMQDLIERLEKATGPDRFLDELIARAVGWTPTGQPTADPPSYWFTEAFGMPHYTRLVDAALTLVPEGWEPRTLEFPLGKYRTFGFEIWPPTDHPAWRDGAIIGRGKTAAIAIGAAALKARLADMAKDADGYDPVDDVSKSVDLGRKVIQERMANGGPPWPKPDTSDIPETGEEWFKSAKLKQPDEGAK